MNTFINVVNKVTQASLILASAALDILKGVACAPFFVQECLLLLPFSPYYAFFKFLSGVVSSYKDSAQYYQSQCEARFSRGRFRCFKGLFEKAESSVESAELISAAIQKRFEAAQNSLKSTGRKVDQLSLRARDLSELWQLLQEPAEQPQESSLGPLCPTENLVKEFLGQRESADSARGQSAERRIGVFTGGSCENRTKAPVLDGKGAEEVWQGIDNEKVWKEATEEVITIEVDRREAKEQIKQLRAGL